MAAFLEEQFPKDIDYGSGFSAGFSAEVVSTAGGNEYRMLRHPYLVATLEVDFTRQRDDIITRVIDLNMRAGGKFRAFRVRNYLDFSTNHYRGAPTALDQPMLLVSAGVYQLMRWYGNSADSECSRRRIRKPQAGSVLVGVGGVALPPAQWSVDNTTGLVTMAANKTGAITGISQASSAVVTASNTLAVGDTVHFSGVAGMTQINGLRGTVTARTATQFTVNINSALFSAYTSGGTFNTRPQSGEVVTGGCYFDIPMRFDADLSGSFTSFGVLSATGIGLVEVLNP
nr:DUF2460 domain-containing protein [Pseudomonas sp. UBA6718]